MERNRWLWIFFCAALLLALCVGSCAEEGGAPYERVIIFAVDGAGAAVSKVDTPNFDRIFGEGCVTYEAKATIPTMSAPGWGAVFYGVRGSVHSIDNTTANRIHKMDYLYPSIFKLVKDAYPKSKVAAYACWHAIPWGLIEWDQGVDIYPKKEANVTADQVTENLMAYLDKRTPKLLFVYYMDVDTVLHTYGYESKEHTEELMAADTWIGTLYDNFQQRGLLDNALVLFVTDHGGKGISHGGGSDEEINCTFAAAGPGVENHGVIRDMELQDVAAVVLYALGVEQPEIQTARIPEGIFPGVGGEARKADPFPELLKYYGDKRMEKVPDAPMPSSLSENLVYRQTFDEEEIKGAAGAARKTTGIIADAMDLRGSYLKTGKKLNMKWPGFTIGFWFRDDGLKKGDPVFIADKNWTTGKNKGFAIAKNENRLMINVGGGTRNRKDILWTLPEGYEGKWIHCLVTFDKASQEVSLYIDFEYVGKAQILPKRYSDWFSKKEIFAGQDTTEKYRYWPSADMDELVIFSKALTKEDVGELRKWYDSCFGKAAEGVPETTGDRP